MGIKNLLFFVGILVLAAVIAVSILFYKQRNEERLKFLSLDEEIDVVSDQKEDILKKIKDVNDEIQRLQAELEGYHEKTKALQGDIEEAGRTKSDILAKLAEKEKTASDLNSRLISLMQQESELEKELEMTRSDYQHASRDIESTQREKDTLEEKIKSRISTPEGVELKKIVVKVNPPIEGKVIEANKEYNFSVIDLGLKDNIKSGDTAAIYRDNQFIARAVVENIYEDMSTIIVLDEWANVPILVSDTVKILKS